MATSPTSTEFGPADIKDIDSNISDELYEAIPVDRKRVVKTGIENSFDSPTKKVEELIDNSKDAHANKSSLVLRKKHRMLGNMDDGIGIKNYLHLVTWGSGHKEEEEKLGDTDTSGMFGEGAKSILSIADDLKYFSNNGGNNDLFVILKRSPKLPDPLRGVTFFHDDRPKGYCKPDIGTVVWAKNISIENLNEIQNNIKESAGLKFAWLIAKGFKINLRIYDDQDKLEEDYLLPIPQKLSALFDDFPSKVKNIGSLYDSRLERDIIIQAIFIENVNRSERKIYYARKNRIIKEVPTDFDVTIIVNFDSTKITKDRKSFDKNDVLTKEYLSIVNQYMETNFRKLSSPFENLNERQRREHQNLLEKINKMAAAVGIFNRHKKPDKDTKPKKVSVHPQNQQQPSAWLKTRRTTDPAVLKPEDILNEKIIKRRPPNDDLTVIKEEKEKNPTPPMKPRSVLVKKMKPKGGKMYHAIGVNIETEDRDNEETYFDFACRPLEGEPEKLVEIDQQPDKCTLWFNEYSNYFKAKRPKTYPNPQYEMGDMLPAVATGVTQALHGDRNLTYLQYQQKYDRILHEISSLYIGRGEQNTTESTSASTSIKSLRWINRNPLVICRKCNKPGYEYKTKYGTVIQHSNESSIGSRISKGRKYNIYRRCYIGPKIISTSVK